MGGSEAIGRSQGWRTTRIHAAKHRNGLPIAFLLTAGNTSDIKAPQQQPLAGNAYDRDALRACLKNVIPRQLFPTRKPARNHISVQNTPRPPAQQDRAGVQPSQRCKTHRHPRRYIRSNSPQCHMPCGNRVLVAQLSLDPNIF